MVVVVVVVVVMGQEVRVTRGQGRDVTERTHAASRAPYANELVKISRENAFFYRFNRRLRHATRQPRPHTAI